MFVWVMYDITSQKRLQKTARLCERTGLKRIQKSVFLGKLTREQIVSFRENALRWLLPKEDKLVIVPISRDDLADRVELGLDCGFDSLLNKQAVMFV